MNTVLQKAENWEEEFGDCIFFHFHNFEEPPQVNCTSPLDLDFDEDCWTHFIIIDFNLIFDQAQST